MTDRNYNNPKGKTVFVKEHENINQALRRFKRKVSDSKVLEETRERESYEKPTTARKRKAASAKSRWRKHLQEDHLPKKLY